MDRGRRGGGLPTARIHLGDAQLQPTATMIKIASSPGPGAAVVLSETPKLLASVEAATMSMTMSSLHLWGAASGCMSYSTGTSVALHNSSRIQDCHALT